MLAGILELTGVLELHRRFCWNPGCGWLRLRGGAETTGRRHPRVLKRRGGAHQGCIFCARVWRGGHRMLVGPRSAVVLTGACVDLWLDLLLDLWWDLWLDLLLARTWGVQALRRGHGRISNQQLGRDGRTKCLLDWKE